jgi:hypothetical protein
MGNQETNELHKQVYRASENHREFPKAEGSIMQKNGDTKKMSPKEAKVLFEKVEKGDFLGTIDVEIVFKTEAQGLKMAKKFKRLAENPGVKLNVKFTKKISNEKNQN